MKVAGLTADDCRDSIGSNKNIASSLEFNFLGLAIICKMSKLQYLKI